MKKFLWLFLLLIPIMAYAADVEISTPGTSIGIGTSAPTSELQVVGDITTQGLTATGTVDMSSGTLETPNGTEPPASCSVGQIFFDSNATTGRNWFGCTSANTWTLLGDGNDASGGGVNWDDVERISTADADWMFLMRDLTENVNKGLNWEDLESDIYQVDNSFLTWEGSTVDDYETEIGVEDPSSDHQILIPDIDANYFVVTDYSGGNLPTNGHFAIWDNGKLSGTSVAVDGDVLGPATNTDNVIARFNGTDSKTIQDSGVTIDDSDNIVTTGNISGAIGTFSQVIVNGTNDSYWDTTGRQKILMADYSANVVLAGDTTGSNYIQIDDDGVMTFAGAADVNLPAASVDEADLNFKFFKGISVENPVDTDSFLIFKAPTAITVSDIYCIVDPADSSESVVIDVQECNGTGDSCSSVDAAITCDNDGAEDDGSLSNGAIDAGDWVLLDIGTTTGTVTWLNVTVNYSE